MLFTLKGVLEQIMPLFIAHYKVRFRHKNCFATHILYAYHQETFRTGIEKSHFWFKYTEQKENATPELFAINIQNYANQECK